MGTCDSCGRPIDIHADLLSQKIEDLEVLSLIGRGFYGWTLLAKNRYTTFALKLVPLHRLELKRQDVEKEAKAAAACGPHRNLAKLYDQLTYDVTVLGEVVTCSVLIFEYIDGAPPLSNFLKSHEPVSPKDIIDILIGITSGLERMHQSNLWHDDLHDGNILIRAVRPDENLPEKYEVKLIDFGSTKKKSCHYPEHGTTGDYYYFTKHIFNLCLLYEYTKKDKQRAETRSFTDELRTLGQQLSDPDITRQTVSLATLAAQLR